VVKLIHLRMNVTVLDIKMLTLVKFYQYFEGIWCHHLLKVEKLLNCNSAHCSSADKVDFNWRC